MDKSRIWYPVAVAFTAINLAAAGYAGGLEDPAHAAVHLGLMGVGAWWASRLRRRGTAEATGTHALERDDRLAMLENELEIQRRELADAQERLDFAERLLTRAAEQQREPERLP